MYLHTVLCKFLWTLTIYNVISGILSYTVFDHVDGQQR